MVNRITLLTPSVLAPRLMAALTSVALGLAILMVVASRANEVYFRAPCQPGISYPVMAANGAGEILVTWQETQSKQALCETATAVAAIGSSGAGFTNLGTISASDELSYPTDAFLNDADNGWIVGVHEAYARSNKYESEYKKTGAWFAFRPAGAHFLAPIELPTKGAPANSALVTGNQMGRTLFAWSTELGTYLAWGTPSGGVSTPTFVGRGFQASSLGVDESGRALIVGYYPSKRYEDVEIAAVTAGASGSFSRPHILVVQPRNARKHLIGYFGLPLVAIGPRGNAVIAWESDWANQRTGYEYSGPNTMIYRRADGRFDKPIRLAKELLLESDITVDSSGRAVIVAATADHGLQEVTVSPSDRVGSPRRLWGHAEKASLAGNELGQTFIAWEDGLSHIETVVGNTRGINGARQTLISPHYAIDYEIAATIDANGVATVVWLAEQSSREREQNSRERILYAQAVAPGARIVKIVSSVDPSGPAIR